MPKVYYWMPEQDALLRKIFSTYTWAEILKEFPEFSKDSILARARKFKLKRHKQSSWTENELDILRKNWKSMPYSELAKLIPNHPKRKAMQYKAEEMGLKRNRGFKDYEQAFTTKQIDYLKEHYENSTWKTILNNITNHPKECIRNKANQLGLKRNIKFTYSGIKNCSKNPKWIESCNKVWASDEFKEQKSKDFKEMWQTNPNMQGKLWKPNEIELLKQYYPITPWKELIKLVGHPMSSCIDKAKELHVQRPMFREIGLTKSRTMLRHKKNKCEKKLHLLIKKALPNHGFIYNGNKRFIGQFKPDFISESNKQICEHMGRYWHGEKRTGQTRQQQEERRIINYSAHGYKTLFVWEEELDFPKKVLEKLILFSIIQKI